MSEPPTSPDNPATSDSLIEMAGVDVPSDHAPGRLCLSGVNWRVAPGEFWFIGGLHRSGKSSLLHLAAGLSQPLAGTYRLFGNNLESYSEAEIQSCRRRLGLVFDGGRLLHHLTVAENVSLPLRYHRNLSSSEAGELIEPLLQFAALNEGRDQFPGSLSRNFQQRAGLARALALQPELLMVDSPLSGLDPREEDWWLERLSALADGHPVMEGRRLPLVVTGTSFRKWKKANRGAVLQGTRFHVLKTNPLRYEDDGPILQPVLPSDVEP